MHFGIRRNSMFPLRADACESQFVRARELLGKVGASHHCQRFVRFVVHFTTCAALSQNHSTLILTNLIPWLPTLSFGSSLRSHPTLPQSFPFLNQSKKNLWEQGGKAIGCKQIFIWHLWHLREREVTSEKVSTKLNFFLASISKYVTNSAFIILNIYNLCVNQYNLFWIVWIIIFVTRTMKLTFWKPSWDLQIDYNLISNFRMKT